MDNFAVNLLVPYLSQDDPQDNATSNTCGPVSAAMVMNYITGANTYTGNQVYKQTGAGTALISVQQLLTAIQSFGFQAVYKENLTFTDIENALQSEIPPIVLVHAADLSSRQDQGFGGGHFIVLDGYRNDGVTANDPDFWGDFRAQGDHHFYTQSDFINAWKDCVQDGNPPNSMILITKDVAVDSQTFQTLVSKSTKYDDFVKIGYTDATEVTTKIASLQTAIDNANTRIGALTKQVQDLTLEVQQGKDSNGIITGELQKTLSSDSVAIDNGIKAEQELTSLQQDVSVIADYVGAKDDSKQSILAAIDDLKTENNTMQTTNTTQMQQFNAFIQEFIKRFIAKK
jgi:hypothetical protein